VVAKKAITSNINYTSGNKEELNLYSASPCTLRTTTRTRKALPSTPLYKRVRLNLGKCYGLHPYRSLGVLRRQPVNRPVTDVSGTARNETLASISGGRARTTGNV
jgi:hypothetical protein